MNLEGVISAECAHEQCGLCRYDDCACECHDPSFDNDPDELYDSYGEFSFWES